MPSPCRQILRPRSERGVRACPPWTRRAERGCCRCAQHAVGASAPGGSSPCGIRRRRPGAAARRTLSAGEPGAVGTPSAWPVGRTGQSVGVPAAHLPVCRIIESRRGNPRCRSRMPRSPPRNSYLDSSSYPFQPCRPPAVVPTAPLQSSCARWDRRRAWPGMTSEMARLWP
eukprot:scaffold2795_cov106-Isochrysis_galbana.AAC.5